MWNLSSFSLLCRKFGTHLGHIFHVCVPIFFLEIPDCCPELNLIIRDILRKSFIWGPFLFAVVLFGTHLGHILCPIFFPWNLKYKIAIQSLLSWLLVQIWGRISSEVHSFLLWWYLGHIWDTFFQVGVPFLQAATARCYFKLQLHCFDLWTTIWVSKMFWTHEFQFNWDMCPKCVPNTHTLSNLLPYAVPKSLYDLFFSNSLLICAFCCIYTINGNNSRNYQLSIATPGHSNVVKSLSTL